MKSSFEDNNLKTQIDLEKYQKSNRGLYKEDLSQALGISKQVLLSEKTLNIVQENIKGMKPAISLSDFIKESWNIFQKHLGDEVKFDEDGLITQKQYEENVPTMFKIDNGKLDFLTVKEAKKIPRNVLHSSSFHYRFLGIGGNLATGVNEDMEAMKNTALYDSKYGHISVSEVFNDFLKGLSAPY